MRFILLACVILCLAGFTGCEPPRPGVVLTYGADLSKLGPGETPNAEELANVLNARLDRNTVARPVGSEQVAVEVFFVPTSDELAAIKRRIVAGGALEFRITAQPTRSDIRSIIAAAMQLSADETNVVVQGVKTAEWVEYMPEEFGGPDAPDDRIVKRMAGETPQALVLIDSWNVTGEFLNSATRGIDDRDGPAVNFAFNSAGAGRLRQLTSENLPNQATGTFRHLGIILDKRLISAPRLHSTISERCQISGGGMTVEEVESIVGILDSGQLPTPIKLISEVRPPGGGQPASTVSPIVAAFGAGVLLLVLGASAILVFKLR
jgi:SecD/SecF fusion protein